MRIDAKYFIPFIAIVAVMSALLIAYFTISVRSSRQQAFIKQIRAQDSLKYQMMPTFQGEDSLGVQSFENSYVILDFWATWTASFSEKAHQQLARLKKQYPERLQVLAAVVEDKPERVRTYINRYNYPFHYVKGTYVFNKFDLPGVPTQLVYSPRGELISIFTGSADAARLDSLKSILTNG